MIWSGATLRSSIHLAGPPSWPWAAAWAETFAILALIASCLYRAIILSIMVKLAPLLSCVVLLFLTSITAAALVCWGGRPLPSVWHGACSLLLPLGHSLNTPIMVKVAGGLPEAERSRINMEELLRKARKVFLLHSVVSLLLLAPYFTFLEIFLHSNPSNYSTTFALLNRPLTHSLPLLLLLLSLTTNLVYLH